MSKMCTPQHSKQKRKWKKWKKNKKLVKIWIIHSKWSMARHACRFPIQRRDNSSTVFDRQLLYRQPIFIIRWAFFFFLIFFKGLYKRTFVIDPWLWRVIYVHRVESFLKSSSECDQIIHNLLQIIQGFFLEHHSEFAGSTRKYGFTRSRRKYDTRT